MSFLERLRKGVGDIETEVKKLKELTEEGQPITEEQLKDNLTKAKSFDADVRKTYAEVSQLLNAIKSSGDPLVESKNRILSIKQTLCDIENNSGLKKFGYKPFEEQYSIETMAANAINGDKSEEQTEVEEVVDKPTDNYSNSDTINAKFLAEEFALKTVVSEEQTTQTVRFARDMPVVNKKNESNDRKPKVVTKKSEPIPVQNISKKYEKLLARTPQLQDFGITRRFTFMPQICNDSKMDAKYTPEEPPLETTQTYRFNYMSNNGFHLGSAANPMTPPKPFNNNSNNNHDSFVTVEFTPGLTTKRPKGISRVQNNDSNNGNKNPMNKTFNNYNKQKESKKWADTTTTHRLPQSILQSVENDKITPEQPIPITDKKKSAHILRSIAAKGSGTPPLPKSRIDANLHNQILKHL